MTEAGFSMEMWRAALKEAHVRSTTGRILSASKHGLVGTSKDIMHDYNLTKFRMKDGAELIVETNEGWIEVDGLRISMEILQSVAKKINEEKEIQDGWSGEPA
jgi:hypothetical protein